MKKLVRQELKLNVSESLCKQAKRLVKKELSTNYLTEYARLEAYASEIRSNPGSACDVQLMPQYLRDGRRVFWRMFVCFDACRRGWINGCGPIIGMDGCFLKGPCKGQLLVAVGKDGNNHMFPVAWAIVDVEDKPNWRWFLDRLSQMLDLKGGIGLTIISDMQKGLIPAIEEALPQAEHRWCARHIYANWSKDFRGGELKQKFWKLCLEYI
ncbi:uncharacterized protein LOC126668921 [Mercurialis annua]|uniref:uncharacterized protein LOC126668921 n=1 Tax=Mercurialis annua TaxID=3986 RepID=UPI00215FF8D9|nr:uncharacterized protein LOC126668921 [Mercurialis annua]